MMIHDRTGHEFEKKFWKGVGKFMCQTSGIEGVSKKSKLLHEHRGVPFNP